MESLQMENNMKLESSENSVNNESQALETSQLVESSHNNGLVNNQLATSGIQLVQGNNQASAWNNSLQMMLLPSGVQPNFLNNSNLITLQDGHLLVTPVSESNQQDPNFLAQQLLLQQQLQQPNLLSHKTESELSQPRQTLLESQVQSQQPIIQKTMKPKLPKKPLNTYMMFSKAIWPQVKAANSHLSSVTEIGAIVGAIWRDLDASQKQQYNEYFIKDKERYENELREYRQMTGLSETDSIRPPNKKRCKDTRALSTTTVSTTWQPSSNSQQTNHLNNHLSTPHSNTSSNSTTPILSQDSLSIAADSMSSNQLLTQQVLAQAGLTPAGQLLFANSDGNIDNNLVNILAQHSQSLQMMPGAQNSNNMSGDKQVDNLVSTLMANDQNSWLWQQTKLDGTVDVNSLQAQQNLTSDVFKDSATTLYYDEQQKQFYLKNESGVSALITGIDPSTGMVSLDPTSTPVLTKEQLEAELQQLTSALTERTNQVQMLTTRLEEAKQIIEHYQQQMQQITAVAVRDESNGSETVASSSTPEELGNVGSSVCSTSGVADVKSDASVSSPSTTITTSN